MNQNRKYWYKQVRYVDSYFGLDDAIVMINLKQKDL